MLINTTSNVNHLESQDLQEWADLAKCQKWVIYDLLTKEYGDAAYYLISLEAASKANEKKFIEQMLAKLKNNDVFVSEKCISRLVFLILNNEIRFDPNYQASAKELFEKIHIDREEFVTNKKDNQLILCKNEKKQKNILDNIIVPFYKHHWEVVFPDEERTLENLIQLSTFPGSGKEHEDRLATVKKIIEGSDTKYEKLKTLLNTIDARMKECTEKIENGRKIAGKTLRNTQKVAILLSHLHERNILAQVNTGEGKSLIITALTILKVLDGGPTTRVDIITSSSVLAERDAAAMKELYATFGITVAHNCDENIEKRKQAYKCQIVYGDITSFERDYLLHTFYNKNILGSRTRQHVIVDEVDAMLLDYGGNMLYLAHNVSGLELLEPLFVFMYKEICTTKWDHDSKLPVLIQLRRKVIAALYGLITEEDIDVLLPESYKPNIQLVWKMLGKYQIIKDDGILLNIDETILDAFEKKLAERTNPTIAISVREMISIVQSQKKEIRVPNYLRDFVVRHLSEFVDNAFKSLSLQHEDEYVVDYDRSGKNSGDHQKVIIIDKGAGTDLSSSQWNEGLQQMCQIKHGCFTTPMSLKAVFVSNVTYLKGYEKINGFSGTLGSKEESKSLRDLYDADVVRIPTWKPKKFNENVPVLSHERTDWVKIIHERIIDQFDSNRSVLLICKSIGEVANLYKELIKHSEEIRSCYLDNFKKAVLYRREYNEFEFEKGRLGIRQLIVSTNLAGRGTDILLSKELENAGGLHVIISFLPDNQRTEEQAYGRAARCGQPGSGQIIALQEDKSNTAKNIFQLKQFRDNAELHRLGKLKHHYDFYTNIEEECLEQFRDHCRKVLKNIDSTDETQAPSVLQTVYFSLLDEWAMWLDEQTEKIKLCEKRGMHEEKNYIISLTQKFIETHSLPEENSFESQLNSMTWIRAPHPYLHIALSLIQQGKGPIALNTLEILTAQFPDYTAEAYYYMGVLNQKNIRKYREFKQETWTDMWRDCSTIPEHILRPLAHGSTKVKNIAYSLMQYYKTLEELPDFLVDHNIDSIINSVDMFTRSKSEFLKKIKVCKYLSSLVDQLCQQAGQQHMTQRGYSSQQEHRIAVYEAYLGNIGDIIGHTVTLSDFELSTDMYNRSFMRKSTYQKNGCISPVVLRSDITIDSLLEVAQENFISVRAMYNFFMKLQQDNDQPEFIEGEAKTGRKQVSLETILQFEIPSVLGFWKCLREEGCFFQEQCYIAIKKGILEELSRKLGPKKEIQLGPFDITRTDNKFDEYDYYEGSLQGIKEIEIEKEIRQAMENGDAYMELVGTLNIGALKATETLTKFDYVTEVILSEQLGIRKEMASYIIEKLLSNNTLRKTTKTFVEETRIESDAWKFYPAYSAIIVIAFMAGISGLMDLSMLYLGLIMGVWILGYKVELKGKHVKKVTTMVVYNLSGPIDLSSFPENLQHDLGLILSYCFCYGYALKALKHSINQTLIKEDIRHIIILPQDPYKKLYNDLISHGVLIDQRVTTDFHRIYKENQIPEKIYEKLKNKAPLIMKNTCTLVSTADFLREKGVNVNLEIRRQLTHGLRQVAHIKEANKWTWSGGMIVILSCILVVPLALFVMSATAALILVAAGVVVGSIMYFASLILETKKQNAEVDSDEHEMEILLDSHKIVLKASEEASRQKKEIKEIRYYADRINTKIKAFIMAHCSIPSPSIDKYSEFIVESHIKESPILSHLERSLECFILSEMNKQLTNFLETKAESFQMSDKNGISENLLDTILVFAMTVIVDIKKKSF